VFYCPEIQCVGLLFSMEKMFPSHMVPPLKCAVADNGNMFALWEDNMLGTYGATERVPHWHFRRLLGTGGNSSDPEDEIADICIGNDNTSLFIIFRKAHTIQELHFPHMFNFNVWTLPTDLKLEEIMQADICDMHQLVSTKNNMGNATIKIDMSDATVSDHFVTACTTRYDDNKNIYVKITTTHFIGNTTRERRRITAQSRMIDALGIDK
jgi:hypothetical protein